MSQACLHALSNLRLLAFVLLHASTLKFSLELFIRGTRLHDLFNLILGVFNDFVGPLFFGFEQLDSVVQSNDIQLNLLPTLTDLRDGNGLLFN